MPFTPDAALSMGATSLKRPPLFLTYVNFADRFSAISVSCLGGSGMQEYRIYFIDVGGGLARAPHEFTASGDDDAVRVAEAWREGRRMELWQNARRIRCWDFPT